MTIVPPENSTPFGMPYFPMTMRPARMITHERAIACHRHLTKLKFGFLKICITLIRVIRGSCYPCDSWLNAERRLPARRELQLVDRLRHEDRREQVHHQANRQRRRKAADRARAELEEERRGNERRDVGVEQGPEHAAESGVDRRAHTALRGELLLDAFEDEHVRVEADAHRQHEA